MPQASTQISTAFGILNHLRESRLVMHSVRSVALTVLAACALRAQGHKTLTTMSALNTHHKPYHPSYHFREQNNSVNLEARSCPLV